MNATIKPGDLALAALLRPQPRLLGVRVRRVWVSLGNTVRCDVEGTEANGLPLRPGMSVDRRQLISLSALENLSADPEEAQSAVAESLAGKAGAALLKS
jgi:hypothetical protein